MIRKIMYEAVGPGEAITIKSTFLWYLGVMVLTLMARIVTDSFFNILCLLFVYYVVSLIVAFKFAPKEVNDADHQS